MCSATPCSSPSSSAAPPPSSSPARALRRPLLRLTRPLHGWGPLALLGALLPASLVPLCTASDFSRYSARYSRRRSSRSARLRTSRATRRAPPGVARPVLHGFGPLALLSALLPAWPVPLCTGLDLSRFSARDSRRRPSRSARRWTSRASLRATPGVARPGLHGFGPLAFLSALLPASPVPVCTASDL
jgi:hypothetical protein